MTYALSRLLAQKKKILFFIIWIPAAVFLFSYFRFNDAKNLGVELCGFDSYMLFQDSFVFLVCCCITWCFIND